MDAVNLKNALAVAVKFTDPKAPERHYNVVKLVAGSPGWVYARSRNHGVMIPCQGLDVSCAVDAQSLKAMLARVGNEVKLSIVKGRKLKLRGNGATYTIQSIAERHEPEHPAAPQRGWTDMTAAYAGALTSLVSIVESKSIVPGLGGVTFTPDWTASARTDASVVVWGGLVTAPNSVPEPLLKDLTGAQRLAFKGRAAFLQAVDTGIVRWSQCLEQTFPIGSVNALLTQCRGATQRTVMLFSSRELTQLLKNALVVAKKEATGFRLEMTPEGLQLYGGEANSQYGALTFTASIAGQLHTDCGPRTVGVRPESLLPLVAAVASVGETVMFSLGGPTDPILIYGGTEPVIEAVASPIYLVS